jgi:hypothetical protein
MKRLFNEFGAATYEGEVRFIDERMDEAFEAIWNRVVVVGDYCPRDAESLCHSYICGRFAEKILLRGINKSRAMRAAGEPVRPQGEKETGNEACMRTNI